MADEKVYGIAESKSKVEVPRKTDVYSKSETYAKSEVYNKNETYSQSQTNTNFLRKTDGAPKSHASPTNEYGLGTINNFGHVKLTTSLEAPSGDQNGMALAGSMGYILKQTIDAAIADLHAYIDAAVESASRLPLNAFVFTNIKYTAEEMTEHMGYGTWVYCFRAQMADVETAGSYWSVFAYKRDA